MCEFYKRLCRTIFNLPDGPICAVACIAFFMLHVIYVLCAAHWPWLFIPIIYTFFRWLLSDTVKKTFMDAWSASGKTSIDK